MRKVFDYIKKCKIYYLLTIYRGKPEGRPFGSLLEYEGSLFFATATTKAVYHQLKEDHHIQIIAKQPDTVGWLRLTGEAEECFEGWIREEMFSFSPRCQQLFSSAEDPTLAVFRIRKAHAEFN